MDEVDNLVKILLEDYKAREIFCFGYIQKNIFFLITEVVRNYLLFKKNY